MGHGEHQSYVKKVLRATINKNGEPAGWKILEQYPDEYWSRRAVERRGIREQYPRLDTETQAQYEERINGIMAIIRNLGKDAILGFLTPVSINKPHMYGDPKDYERGDPVFGFEFRKKDPESHKQRYYGELFKEIEQRDAENSNRNRAIRLALRDELRARNNNELLFPHYDDKANRPETIRKNVARFYIGPLNNSFFERDKYGSYGVFCGAGEEAYSQYDEATLGWTKERIWENMRLDGEWPENGVKLGRMFEGFFYPLVRFGFFDLPEQGKHGAVILSSSYDDMCQNKVDIGAVVPMKVRAENGEEGVENIPICFDLTTSIGREKKRRVRRQFCEKKGFSNIIYPSTCYKKALPSMTNVPFFVMCIANYDELGSFMDALSKKQLPSQEIQDVINFQIYEQARLFAEYWDGQLARGEREDIRDEKVRLFRTISNHFRERLHFEPGAEGIYKNQLLEKHPQSMSHLLELERIVRDYLATS